MKPYKESAEVAEIRKLHAQTNPSDNTDWSEPNNQNILRIGYLLREVNTIQATLAEAKEEADFHYHLITRQGRLLNGVVNAIRGEPDELSMHSHHDAPELATRAMALLRLVTFAGRITGGTAGRDEQLCAALDAVEAFLPPVVQR